MRYRIVKAKLRTKPPQLCGSALRVILSGGGMVECKIGERDCMSGPYHVNEQWVEELYVAGFLEVDK